MYYDRKRIHRISKNLNSYNRKEENAEGEEHLGESSPLNTALGTAVATPGLAIDAVTTLPAGLLKKTFDKLCNFSLDALDKFDKVVSDPLMEKSMKSKSKFKSFLYDTLSMTLTCPAAVLAYSTLAVGTILKLPFCLIEKAGSLISKPFKLAGRHILKNGNEKVYSFVDRMVDIEQELEDE